MNNKAMELHDSTLSSVQGEGEFMTLVFDKAYIHESLGRPGVDNGIGYGQIVHFTLYHPVIYGHWPELPSEIRCGELKVGDVLYDNVIPCSNSLSGKITFMMRFFCKREVSILARSIDFMFIGKPENVEDFQGIGNQSI